MKRIILLFLGILACCPIFADDLVLTPNKAKFLKDKCLSTIKEYYGNVNLVSVNYLTADDKAQAVINIQNEFFLDGDIRIASDFPSMTQPDYNVLDYFNNISLLSSQVDNVDISIDNDKVQISDVYNSDGQYFMMATVQENINTSHENGEQPPTVEKKTMDIYFQISPDSKLKIYSIQTHKDGVLASLQPAPFAQENVPAQAVPPDPTPSITSSETSTIPQQQQPGGNYASGGADAGAAVSYSDAAGPTMYFRVSPANATIFIDGNPIYNDGSLIPTTYGEHSIEVDAPNYFPEKFNVTVDNVKPMPIELRLERLMGYLAINTENPNIIGADVRIDEQFVGRVPLADYQLPVGAHTVVIHGMGYWRRFRVVINAENVTALNIQGMEPVFWVGTPLEFSVAYPSLYVYYPPREYPDYPRGYWYLSAREHRDFEYRRFHESYAVRERVRYGRLTSYDRTVSRESSRRPFPSHIGPIVTHNHPHLSGNSRPSSFRPHAPGGISPTTFAHHGGVVPSGNHRPMGNGGFPHPVAPPPGSGRIPHQGNGGQIRPQSGGAGVQPRPTPNGGGMPHPTPPSGTTGGLTPHPVNPSSTGGGRPAPPTGTTGGLTPHPVNPSSTGGGRPAPPTGTTGGLTPHPVNPSSTGGGRPAPPTGTTGGLTPHPVNPSSTGGGRPAPPTGTTGGLTPHPVNPSSTGGGRPAPPTGTTGGLTPHPMTPSSGGMPHPNSSPGGASTPHSGYGSGSGSSYSPSSSNSHSPTGSTGSSSGSHSPYSPSGSSGGSHTPPSSTGSSSGSHSSYGSGSTSGSHSSGSGSSSGSHSSYGSGNSSGSGSSHSSYGSGSSSGSSSHSSYGSGSSSGSSHSSGSSGSSRSSYTPSSSSHSSSGSSSGSSHSSSSSSSSSSKRK